MRSAPSGSQLQRISILGNDDPLRALEPRF